MHRIFLLFALWGILLCTSAAQQYPFARYGTTDGLAQNYITSIVQDHRGFLWVGTGDAGVSKFDGREFITFDRHDTQIPGAVSALATDGARFLFVGGSEGVSCIRLSSNTKDGADTVLNRMLGRVEAPVRELYMRSPRELYIGGSEHAWMFNLTDSTLRLTPVLPLRHGYLSASFPDVEIRGMARDCDRRIWLATDKGLVLHDDAGSTTFDRSNGLAVDDVLSVFCDDEGSVWAGTVDGLFRYTVSRLVNYLPGRELSADARGVWSVLSTRDDVVWIGTIGGGVTRLFGGERRTFRVKDGMPSDNVSSLLELPNGDILAGTDNGLVVITGSGIMPMADRIALPDLRVEAMHQSSDIRYWIATRGGLAVWNGNETRVYTTALGLPSNRITSMAEDGMGFLWVGTHAGAARINLRSGNVFPVPELADVRIVCIHIDKQERRWFGTVGGGALCISSEHTARITRDDGLAGNTVYFIAEDEHNTLYFGTNTGISVLPAGNIDLMLGKGPTLVHGGIDRDVVLPVLRFQSLHTLSTRSGLAGDEMNSGASYRDAKGRLWFGAIGGVSCFQPQKPPSLSRWSFPECGTSADSSGMQRIWLAEIYINDTLTVRRGTLELGPSDRVLRIRLLAPSFRNPGSVRFLYKLDGLEYTWHSSDDGRILYTAIPAGQYKLLVRATLGEGHWTTEHVMLTLHVSPPFTETIWFWLLLLLLAALSGATLMYWRSRKQIEMERMRTHIASDLHDDIGASLGTISLLSDLERRRQRTGDLNNLETIGTLARRCVQDMSDIVWSVNPAHDSMRGLTNRLRETAEELSAASGIAIVVEASEVKPLLRIEAAKRRAVMLIAKEALFNAVRHSGAARIVLRLEKDGSSWMLTVRDDGRGFDPASTGDGNGLRNMQRRAEALGWSIDIEPTPQGSTVTLYFHL